MGASHILGELVLNCPVGPHPTRGAELGTAPIRTPTSASQDGRYKQLFC